MEPIGRDVLPNDEELAALLQNDQVAAVQALYERDGGLAYGLAYRIMNDQATAEDVVQEAFVAVLRNTHRFNSGRESLRSFLLSIVHHRAIDRLRGSSRIDPDAGPAMGSEDVSGSSSIQLKREQVQAAFARLPQAQRRTLELAYFRGLTHGEIAAQTKLPLAIVKGQMRTGLETMQRFLGTKGSDQ